MAKRLKPQSFEIDYLARVEGETALVVRVGDDSVDEIKLKIWEPPRFFERFLVGRKYDEVGDIVSRICGICPISHMTTALQAVEDAMDTVPSPQTKQLRRLMCMAQVVASHIVHLYMFAVPDYFGYPGFVQMIPKFQEETKNFLKMKEAMNRVGEVIGGRALHPISMVVGGFTRVPAKASLMSLAKGIEEVVPLACETVRFVSRLPYPDLRTNNELVALRSDSQYPSNGGRLVSSRGLDVGIHEYSSVFQEKQEMYAMAKKSTVIKDGASFMVGALARVNLNFDHLHEETKRLAQEIGFVVPDTNPFHNNIAQALEIHNGMIECVRLLSEITPEKEKPQIKIQEGEGLAITEAPRGLLMHSYAVNSRGVIEEANLVMPTSHNFANIEKDLRLLVVKYSQEDKPGNLRLACEQLIRAYDPCFSCSVH